MLSLPITPAEKARLASARLIRHFSQNKKWYISHIHINMRTYYAGQSAILNGLPTINPSHDELVELVKSFLNIWDEWHKVLQRKSHLPYLEWDTITDCMARHIVNEVYDEIV